MSDAATLRVCGWHRAAVTTALGTKRAAWREALHPRDRLGRFIEVGGECTILGGGSGKVQGASSNGRITVDRNDGRRVTVDSGYVTMTKHADGRPYSNADAPAEGSLGALHQGAAAPDPLKPDHLTAGQTDATPPSAPDLPGSEPAPGASPVGAFAYFATPDATSDAWLRNDEGDATVGYLRDNAADPASSVRYGDAQAWAKEADSRGMSETDVPTVDPATDTPDAPAQIPAQNAQAIAPEDKPKPGHGEVQPGRLGIVASDEQVNIVLHDGLPKGPEGRAAAKAAVVDQLVSRMEHVPDEALLGAEESRTTYAPTTAWFDNPDGTWSPVNGMSPSIAATLIEQGKAKSGTDPVVRAQGRREAVNRMVAQWANTSNDADAHSLAMQDIARDLFGLEGTADWGAIHDPYSGVSSADIDAVREKHGQAYEAFLQAQYDATQERFAAAGITHVTVVRGHKVYAGALDEAPWLDEMNAAYDPAGGADIEVPLRPLSSFTTDPSIAVDFAARKGTSSDVAESLIFEGSVPVERIIATPRTGIGCLDESELVLLGGPGKWNVKRAEDYDPALAADTNTASYFDLPDPAQDTPDPGATGGGDPMRYDGNQDAPLGLDEITQAADLHPSFIENARDYAAAVAAEYMSPTNAARREALYRLKDKFEVAGLEMPADWAPQQVAAAGAGRSDRGAPSRPAALDTQTSSAEPVDVKAAAEQALSAFDEGPSQAGRFGGGLWDIANDGGPGTTAEKHLDAVLTVGQAVRQEADRRAREIAKHSGARPVEEIQADIDAATAAERPLNMEVQDFITTSKRDWLQQTHGMTFDEVKALEDKEQRRKILSEYLLHDVELTPDLAKKEARSKALYREYEALVSERKDSEQAHRKARAQAYKETLAQVRDMGPGEGNTRVGVHRNGEALTAEQQAAFTDAIRHAETWYPTDWVNASAAMHPVLMADGARGAHDARSGYMVLTNLGTDEGNSVAVHELGHRMEYLRPQIKAMEWAYLWRRAAIDNGDGTRTLPDAERLVDLPGSDFYRDDEITHKDQFVDPYTGRTYGGSPRDSYEILTTAIESLFGTGNYLDPDLEAWALGALAVL